MNIIQTFQNLDLISVGLIVAATVILGFAVYFNNPKSITNKTFFWFALVTAIWGTVNYLAYQSDNPTLVLWLLRFIMFFAVWQAFTFFQLCFVFPETEKRFPKTYLTVLVPIVILTSFITLTPLLFSKIVELAEPGKVSNPDRGPGLFLFGPVAVGLVLAGFIILTRKTALAQQQILRQSHVFLLSGAVIMFTLIIIFNFIIPIFTSNRDFIPLGALFVFPFIGFTSYAILRRRLFNVRAVWAGVLVFLLAMASFSEVILARELALIIYRSSILIFVLVFGKFEL